jgi:hypothetical protein
MSGERAEVYLLDRPSHSIELDYLWQVVVLACFSREVIPSSGNQPSAAMERIKHWRDFFFSQELFEKRLKTRVKLEEVLTFDPLKFSQSRHNQSQVDRFWKSDSIRLHPWADSLCGVL